jgi:penicillin-binding protein 2
VVSDPDGTAFGAFAGFPLNRFPVAGKTGTAEVFGKQDTALFSAFAPADNPQYVVTVVMEESGFGAAAAAPVARRVLEGLAGGAPQPVQRAAGLD